jgi:hypothetical protein
LLHRLQTSSSVVGGVAEVAAGSDIMATDFEWSYVQMAIFGRYRDFKYQMPKRLFA